MKAKLLLLILITLTSLSPLRSQVTIGSGIEPRSGLLLELKEGNDNSMGVNSSKGFSLPRVRLNSLTDLTVDNNSKNGEYAGLTVYNTNTDPQKGLTEGTYTWDGNKWNHIVPVSGYGKDGQTLISRGDGTYDWSDIVFPEYTFHKPTQISTFDSSKKIEYARQYSSVMGTEGTTHTNGPVYNDKLTLQSNASGNTYLLLGFTISSSKATIGSLPPVNGYRESIELYIYLNQSSPTYRTVIKSVKKPVETVAGSSATALVDFFFIIPLKNFAAGTYDLVINATATDHTFRNNAGTAPGNFDSSKPKNTLLSMELVDITYILYEDK